MKKSVLVILLISILLVAPLALSQEQTQTEEQAKTYSGFNRFMDNVKMFFSSGDSKVMLALEIREKEVNSAVTNTKNGDDESATDNLEKAWKKLQVVQEKVSVNTAEQVKENSDEIRNKINNEENLSNDFDVYVLEEEKTGLTAEWVVEVNGKEGQTLGQEVEVVYEINGERIVKIENRINQIDNEIAEWVVEKSIGKDGEGDNGLTWEVKTEVAGGKDNGLKPEVKTYMDVVKNNVIDKSPMTKDNDDVTPAPNVVDDDMCEEGEENCNNDVAPGPDGIVGVIVPEPRDESPQLDSIDDSEVGDSSSGDSGDSESSGEESSGGGEDSGDSESSDGDSAPITGEAIGSGDKESFLVRIFKEIF